MKVLVCENYDVMSAQAAEIFKQQIVQKPNSVLGLATGSTPIGMYDALVAMKLDFSSITTFNLDEYYPIKRSNDQSYFYFMHENLFNKVNIKAENINVPNGETEDAAAECAGYDARIDAAGGLDLQVLGIGQNGHIGFNEPGDYLEAFTHVTGLTDNTIDANARFFASRDEVPTQALTMGVATIMKSKKIVILANGKAKAPIVKELLSNKITTKNPSSVLCMHPDVTLICDRDAYSMV